MVAMVTPEAEPGRVHQRVDAPELGHNLVDGGLNDSLVVSLSIYVCLNRQHADAELALKTLLGGFELLHVTAGDGKVCALFGEGGGDAEPDGARGTVLQPAKPAPVMMMVFPVK